MRGRTVWFVAGTAAGVYATTKARRAAYRLSMPGVIDQAAALGVGWRAFAAELRHGIEQQEHRVVAGLSISPNPTTVEPTPIERDPH